MPKSPLGTQEPRAFSARWSAIALALCLTELVLSVAIAAGPLSLPLAPRAMRWGLLAQECALLSLLAVVPALPTNRWLRLIACSVVALIFAPGWFTFSAVGRFPGIDAIGFFFTVPEQALQHVIELRAGIIPATLLALATMALGLELTATLTERRLSPMGRVLLPAIAIVLLTASSVYALDKGRSFARSRRELYEKSTGVSYRTDQLWSALREGSAGPASGLLYSIWSGRGGLSAPPTDADVAVSSPARAPGALMAGGVPAHHWNVLVIEVESMRADVLAAWGGSQRVMPTVEAIAAESRRYLDSYTTATQTDLAAPVPLSGQYPLRDVSLSAYPKEIRYPKVMVYDVLGPQGWRAGVFSSQNEEWWGMVNFLRSPSLDTLLHAENFSGATYVPRNDLGFARFVRNARRSGKIDDHETVSEALRWLEARPEKPFFVYLNLQTSHLPYATPPSVPRRFGKGPPSFPILFGRYPVDSAEVVHEEYRNALAYVDDQIARVRDALIADGRWDSTIVVLTGDHGQAFFEHQVAAHANGLFQELVQVPLLIRAPGLAAGDDRRPASHVDVSPTIADLLGLPAQPAWQGVSLVAETYDADRPRFFMVQSPLAQRIGVVSGQWKAVRDLNGSGTRLIDLKLDPQGRNDAAPRHPEEARHLLALLDTWRSAQLSYYASTVTPSVKFPPVVTSRTLPADRVVAKLKP